MKKLKQKKNIKTLLIVEDMSVPLDRRVWAEALALKQSGCLVYVICPKSNVDFRSYENIRGVEIYRYPILIEAHAKIAFIIEYANAILWQFILSLWIFIRNRFNIIHASNPPDDICFIAFIYKVFFGVKFIFDYHDMSPESFSIKFNNKGFFYKLLLTLEQISLKTANTVITVNNSVKNLIIERGKIDPSNISVVMSCPILGDFQNIKPEKIQLHYNYLVGYIGQVGITEGLDGFLRSIAYIRNEFKRKDVFFMIIGSGPYLNSIIEYSKKLAIYDGIIFTGKVEHSRAMALLINTDVCVNPNPPNEMIEKATQIKNLEYMALSKPIVQYNRGEGKFTARDAALYAKPYDDRDFGDKILELLDDEKKRKKMGEFGRKRIETELNWDKQKAILIEAYKKVLI